MQTEPTREETVFAAALRLPADERAAFLDRENQARHWVEQRSANSCPFQERPGPWSSV